ncbi:MAG: cupin domain-containing protein [Trebonia sp.]
MADRRAADHFALPVIGIDLGAELAALPATAAYHDADHSATTLAKQSELRVVLVALRAGGSMSEHRADAPIAVQGLEGRIRFDVGDDHHELTPGQVLVVAPGLRHTVVATVESAFLLIIGGLHRSDA